METADALEPDRRMGGWTGIGYGEVEVGQTFPPEPLSITAADLSRFHACLGELPRQVADGARIPAFLLNEFKVVKSKMRFPPGVLHAREEIEMLGAARLGEALQTQVCITDKYIRNAKRFLVVDQRVSRTATGEPVARITHVLYWPC